MKYWLSLFLSILFSLNHYSQDYHVKVLTAENGLPSDQVYDVVKDSKGYLWIGTKNGLARWDSKNFEYFTIKDGLPSNEVLAVFEDKRGRIFFETFSSRLCYFYNNQIFNEKTDTSLKLINVRIGTNIRFSNSNIYFQNNHGKLVMVNTKLLKTTVIHDSLKSLSFQVAGNRVEYITADFLNNLLKKEDYTTLRRLLKDFVYLLDDPEQGLSRAALHKIVPSTYHLGDVIFNAKAKAKIKEIDNNLLVSYDKVEIFSNNPTISKKSGYNVARLYLYKNELNFIEKSGKLFSIYSPNPISQLHFTGSMYNLNRTETTNYLTTSSAIFQLLTGSLTKKGIASLSREQEYFSNYKYCFYSSRLKSIFIGMGDGIFLFKQGFRTTLTKKKTYCIFEDSRNSLWYSSTDSLFVTNHYIPRISEEKSFILNKSAKVFVNDIKEDRNGNMVFASNNGVYIYDPIGKLKYWLNDKNLLTSNECTRVEIDPQDNSIWIATFNGLNHIRYIEKNGKLKFESLNRFFTDDNLYSNEINDILLQGDSVWIATPKGLNLLHNKNHRPDTQKLQLHFNKLYVNEKEVNFTQDLRLDPEENNLTLDYSAIYYERRDRLLIEYRLIRNRDTVTKFIKENRLNLLALGAGDYQLELYAYDQDYPYIHTDTKRLSFSIKPLFYKTIWFWSLVFIAFILLFGIYYYRRLLQRKNRLIEQKEIQNKLKEFSLKSLQNQMNPHFVFNSLNTIQHFISTNNEEEATEYLSGFSQLMRDMIENIERDTITLDKELEFNRRYLQLEQLRYQHKFDINFHIGLDEELSEIFVPTMLIQPILENAIKHGVANLKDRRGIIQIYVSKKQNNLLEIKIVDNGHGNPKKSQSNHKSKAINLVKDRLELYTKSGLSGSFQIEFTNLGTTAILLIPI